MAMAVVVVGLAMAPATGGTHDLSPGSLRRAADGSLYVAPPGAPGGTVVSVCASGCAQTSLAAAVRGARDGDVVTLGPGVYDEAVVIRANRLTLRAEPGAHLRGRAVEGKGAIVIKGSDTLIEGLECSEIAVPDHNGACVRLEGPGLTLRRVYFHDSEQGVLCGLGAGTVTIEDSRFERLGGGEGHAHGVYVGPIDALIIRRSQILASRDQGHEVKSRAKRTVIEDSLIASLDGFDSRLIDVPNGGVVEIRSSVLEEGPNSVNLQVIGFGMEGSLHADNSLLIDKTVVILDRRVTQLIAGPVQPVITATRVIGGQKAAAGTATWFPDRAAAGLAPYPSVTVR